MLGQIMLRRGAEGAVDAGGLWIYDNQIESTTGGIEPGAVCDVYASGGRFLGRGYYNPRSKISVRLLSRQKEEIDADFFRRRITQAWNLRKKLGMQETCRLVFAESDLLPALIVDKFGEYLVIQTLALGIDRYKDTIVSILDELFSPLGIYERNDVPVREKEGLEQIKGPLKGSFDIIEIRENEARMLVDVQNGQKTGYFLDQRENRAAVRPYAPGARVLDAFCHTGGFSVHAGLYGAGEIISADISESALEMARRNFALNGLTNCTTVCANVFDLLRQYQAEREEFDLVILDPPAFVKNRAALEKGYTGYKEINLRALKLIRPGGVLMTFSCSQLMTLPLFLEMLRDAASDAGRTVRLLELRMQSRDHPALIGQDQPLYLKCVVAQVL